MGCKQPRLVTEYCLCPCVTGTFSCISLCVPTWDTQQLRLNEGAKVLVVFLCSQHCEGGGRRIRV